MCGFSPPLFVPFAPFGNSSMDELRNCPYSLGTVALAEAGRQLRTIDDRVSLLRNTSVLTPATLKNYYGLTRFEQVAESNALEGNTLSVGETELAVLKGITLTGHDPAFSRDAQALDAALHRVAEKARDTQKRVDIDELLEIHSLILGNSPDAGRFRSVPVRIGGAVHHPPKTLKEVSDQMHEWQEWSRSNGHLPAILRATVLHAWLTHIHPFTDGNGRTSRAVATLELVRAGFPPIIIKKAEKPRYLSGLSDSDSGGDIGGLLEFFIERADGALLGLENAAKQSQGYSVQAARIRQRQISYTKIWTTSVQLLADMLEHVLAEQVAVLNGRVLIKRLYDAFDVDSFISVSSIKSNNGGWAFIVGVEIPALPKIEALAYFGYRSSQMYHHLGEEHGVSLFWSKPNPEGYPKWTRWDDCPFGVEMTIRLEGGGRWSVRGADSRIREIDATALVNEIATHLY
jgi:Fic family protein